MYGSEMRLMKVDFIGWFPDLDMKSVSLSHERRVEKETEMASC